MAVTARRRIRPHLVLEGAVAIRCAETMGMEAQGRRQHPQLRSGQAAQLGQRVLAVEALAHRADLGDAGREPVGDQADDPRQGVIDQPHPAPDPAHGAGKLDRVAARLAARSATATTASSASSVPGSRAARQSGSRLKVVWVCGQ